MGKNSTYVLPTGEQARDHVEHLWVQSSVKLACPPRTFLPTFVHAFRRMRARPDIQFVEAHAYPPHLVRFGVRTRMLYHVAKSMDTAWSLGTYHIAFSYDPRKRFADASPMVTCETSGRLDGMVLPPYPMYDSGFCLGKRASFVRELHQNGHWTDLVDVVLEALAHINEGDEYLLRPYKVVRWPIQPATDEEAWTDWSYAHGTHAD